MADTPDLATPPPARSTRPLIPPTSVRLIVAGVLLTALLARWFTISGDHAIVNIATFLCGFVAFLVMAGWFVFRSGFPGWLRAGTAIAGFLLLAGLMVAFRIEDVSGELVPTFRPRWSQRPDETLSAARPSDNSRTADLATTTPDDFPQFLGPNRDARVDHVTLSRSWDVPPKKVWQQPIGAGWSAFSAVNGFAVTLEQRGPEELVTCYAIETGDLIWSHGTTTRHETIPGGIGPRSTPTIDGGQVFAQGATGELVCLEGTNGKLLWRVNLLERYGVSPGTDKRGVAWGRSGSPLVTDKLVVIPAGGPKEGPKEGPRVSLVAFDRHSGEIAWEAGNQQVSYSSPMLLTLAGHQQVVCVHEKSASGYEPQTGKILWTFDWPGNSTQDANVSPPLQVGPDRLLFSKGYGQGAALVGFTASSTAPWQLEEIWRERSLLKTKFTHCVLYEGHVYGLSDGILECVDVTTGKRRWKGGRYGQGQILGVRDLLLIQAESGEVALVEANPESLRELARFQALDGKTWNNLCLYGRRLLVRNAEQAACYELP